MGGFFFLFSQARRCFCFVHLSEKSHRGMLLFVLFVFQLLCSCVCAQRKSRWVTPGGQASAHFLSLSRASRSGEALSPAICLPALGIVIPKCRPVNISLVTATSLPQHSRKGGGEAEEERRCSPNSLPFPFSLFIPVSFAKRKKKPLFLSSSTSV